MKQLSTSASLIVGRLIDKAQDHEFYDILLTDQATLNIKCFETVGHADGAGFLLSVGLFADKSRLRFVTRVVSLVIDQRSGDNNAGPLRVMPFYYRDDPNEIVQIGAVFLEGALTLTDEIQQKDICLFMERWVVDLQTDGYV